MIIKNASIYTENHTFVNGNAVVENGRFVSFSDFSEQDAQIVDAQGLYMIPGLVDIHFHGCMGADMCDGTKEALDIIRNKKILADFIEKECPGTQSIPTEMLRDIKELEWDFPVVCKPYNGRSSQGLRYIYNKEEWDEFVLTADKEVYIVEPFIEGPLVMVEIVRQDDPHKVVAMTRRELISTPHGCSTTVHVYKDEELEENSKILADKLNVLGDVNFEYILDKNGTYHFVECNPRFSAGCEFSCMAGYDYVENHMKCFMNKEIEDCHFKHNMIIARKYEEYITATDIDVEYGNTCH